MIQIEDQEDIEAYKEAKAEIDDEFDDEDQAPKPSLQETDLPAEKPSTNEKTEVVKDKPDQKSADGLALQKSEAIDWRTHPTLNTVTKYAISQYEQEFKF